MTVHLEQLALRIRLIHPGYHKAFYFLPFSIPDGKFILHHNGLPGG
jgi:hypothetical protein